MEQDGMEYPHQSSLKIAHHVYWARKRDSAGPIRAQPQPGCPETQPDFGDFSFHFLSPASLRLQKITDKSRDLYLTERSMRVKYQVTKKIHYVV